MQVAIPRVANLRIVGLKLKVIDYTCRTGGLKTYPSGKRLVNESPGAIHNDAPFKGLSASAAAEVRPRTGRIMHCGSPPPLCC